MILVILITACSGDVKNQEKEDSPITETLLLKNFKPRSIYNLTETLVEKAKYPIIDMHSHVYAKNSDEVSQWVETMDAVGIEKTVILSHLHGPDFDSVVDMYSGYPDRFDIWCGIDYSACETDSFHRTAIAELKRCVEKGAKGVGELGDKGKGLFYSKPPAWGMHPDDDRMVAIWRAVAELGLPVNLHVADPKWMYEKMDSTNDGMMNAFKWRLDNQEGIRDHGEMMDILERTLQKNPNTTFVACHFANCSYDLSIAGRLLDTYPNLYLDNSARYAEVSAIPRAAGKFYTAYQDRILYGTDMGRSLNMYRMTFRLMETADEHLYLPYNSYHWPLHALDLPDEVLEKVYRKNAAKIMRDS
ncbi:MAG: amidohydrolase [Bacteroidales bacterium]|nr:amidohydrolase [Bacteroidales bacterium]